MEKNADPLRVVKTLSPNQSGAIKLARKHGDALRCVRQRHDRENLYRVTTIELVVERAPIQSRSDRVVGVRIGAEEKSPQAAARASGAKWDSSARLWRMPHRTATRLGPYERVARTSSVVASQK